MRYFLYLCLFLTVAYADLSWSQARKTIQTAGGISLPSDSVHVQRIEGTDVTAELELVFRVTQHEGRWRLNEVRTGPDRWERLDFIAQAMKAGLPGEECDAPAQFADSTDMTDLTTK